MSNAIEYSIKSLGLFTNKKGEKIEFIEEVMVSIKFPDGVWDIITEFMVEYPHKALTYENNYDYDVDDKDDIIKQQTNIPNYICVMWDYENNILEKTILNDIAFSTHEKQNLMWIDTIKEKNNWKKGEHLYLDFKCNCDGAFYVWGHKTKQTKTHQLYINRDGYVIRYYPNFKKYIITQDTKDVEYKYKKADCMYNDLLKISR